MLLVYKYLPNGTMGEALHGPGKPCMDWATRMKIARGTARGLAYLHEDCRPKIIHRDIKISNILLDEKWEAQVADFGLAKETDDSQTQMTPRYVGTPGYVAPEYALNGELSFKADVYSFGVILLELITGKKAIDRTLLTDVGHENLVEWAKPRLKQALETENVDTVADPGLVGKYDKKEMFTMVAIADVCVRRSHRKRPKMADALRALEPPVDMYQGRDQEIIPGHGGKFVSGEPSEDHLKSLNQIAFGSLTSQSSSADWEDKRSDRFIDAVETLTETENHNADQPSTPSNQLTPPLPQNMKSQQTDRQKPYEQQNNKDLTLEGCCFIRFCSSFITGFKGNFDLIPKEMIKNEECCPDCDSCNAVHPPCERAYGALFWVVFWSVACVPIVVSEFIRGCVSGCFEAWAEKEEGDDEARNV